MITTKTLATAPSTDIHMGDSQLRIERFRVVSEAKGGTPGGRYLFDTFAFSSAFEYFSERAQLSAKRKAVKKSQACCLLASAR